MRNAYGRLVLLARVAGVAALAVGSAVPVAAQFGGLKKKLKAASGTEAAAEGQKPAAPAGNPQGAKGGTIVLTSDVVGQYITGLKAGAAEREAAAKEDTPNTRYLRGVAAAERAQLKCQKAQEGFATRLLTDEKLGARYNALMEKMAQAQGKADYKRSAEYTDSLLAMQDPSCIVKAPERPKDYYEAQRAIDERAEKAAVKGSGLSDGDFSQVAERVGGILYETPWSDASASEKKVVADRSAELKPLLGFKEPAPAPAPAAAAPETPAPAPTAAVPAGPTDMQSCMIENVKKHEARIKALGDRGVVAEEAGNTPVMMAIADTIMRLQMAGCDKHQ